LDTPVHGELLYQKPSESFVQWKAQDDAIHGLNFATVADCAAFDECLKLVVASLQTGSPLPEPIVAVVAASTASSAAAAAPAASASGGGSVSAKVKRDKSDKGTDKLSASAPAAAPDKSETSKRKSSHRKESADEHESDAPAAAPAASAAAAVKVRSLVGGDDGGELTVRDKVLREIYTTECSYVEGLMLLNHQYITPAKSVMSDDDARVVFANLASLTSFNKTLLKDLRGRLSAWHDHELVGDIFATMIPFFKMYEQYCSNHPAAIAKLIELKKKKDVQKFLETGEASVKQKLESLLITPVQRLPRYVLLLRDLLKHTPDSHPDFAKLTEVVNKVDSVASSVNRGMRSTDAQKQFYELQQQKKFKGLNELVAPHREFIAYSKSDGKTHELQIVISDSLSIQHILLFSDLALFCNAAGDIVDRVALVSTWADDLNATGSKFLLVTPEKSRRFIVECASLALKKQWLALFNETIGAWLDTSHVERDADSGRLIDYVWGSGTQKGDRHRGFFRDGRMHGKGTYTTAHGDVYQGTWEENLLTGHCTIQFDAGDVYEGELLSGLPHGRGVLTGVTKSNVYDGEWARGAKEGVGEMRWGSGQTYKGEWKANQMHGTGTLTVGAATYVGEWRHDRKHGIGVLTLPGGVIYEGQWENDARTGIGTLSEPSGALYTGTWKDNKRHGPGVQVMRTAAERHVNAPNTLISPAVVAAMAEAAAAAAAAPPPSSSSSSAAAAAAAADEREGSRRHRRHRRTTADQKNAAADDGADDYPPPVLPDASKITEYLWRFDGTFLNDQREGAGVLKVSGDAPLRYEGAWHAGRRHGHGQQRDIDGEYEGEWVADERVGMGSMLYADGSRYDGAWHANLRHGEGTYKDCCGHIYVGHWRNGRRWGAGKLQAANGRYVYDGDFQDDRRVGQAKETDVNGGTYVGTFGPTGARHGKGKLLGATSRIEGEWVNNLPRGKVHKFAKDAADTASPTQVLTFNDDGSQTQPMKPSLASAAPILFL
jgi:hypothetical protein